VLGWARSSGRVTAAAAQSACAPPWSAVCAVHPLLELRQGCDGSLRDAQICYVWQVIGYAATTELSACLTTHRPPADTLQTQFAGRVHIMFTSGMQTLTPTGVPLSSNLSWLLE